MHHHPPPGSWGDREIDKPLQHVDPLLGSHREFGISIWLMRLSVRETGSRRKSIDIKQEPSLHVPVERLAIGNS
jgi:hypothetical protein